MYELIVPNVKMEKRVQEYISIRGDIKEKLEKLNDYNAKDSEQYEQIVNIFNEIINKSCFKFI